MNDFLLGEDGDLAVFNGDFRIGDSTLQNQQLLLLLQKGEIKEAPISGVGAANYLHDENKDELYREIRREFVRDGMKVHEIQLNKNNVVIRADYE